MKKTVLKLDTAFTKYTLLFSLIVCLILGAGVAAVLLLSALIGGQSTNGLSIAPLFFAALAVPTVLTVENILLLFLRPLDKYSLAAKKLGIVTLFFGITYTLMLFFLGDIEFGVDYDVALYDYQQHTPVWTQAQLTVIFFFALGLIGYLLLTHWAPVYQPPLVTVFSIAAIYAGVTVSVLFCVQTLFYQNGAYRYGSFWLCILPFNFILMCARSILVTVKEKAALERENPDREKLTGLSKLLMKANTLPLFGLIALLPFFDAVTFILVLFGQEPDAIIRAWTNTADWTMSQMTAPPDLPYDAHYLCTVAARGHAKVVKPLRTGRRHGHAVTVNRQLCVANAFEDLIHERTPRFHRAIRGFYDKYGYPIAKHIKSKTAADIVYFMMKPLEWVFLLALYLFDRRPENRIAVQYPHSAPPKPAH